MELGTNAFRSFTMRLIACSACIHTCKRAQNALSHCTELCGLLSKHMCDHAHPTTGLAWQFIYHYFDRPLQRNLHCNTCKGTVRSWDTERVMLLFRCIWNCRSACVAIDLHPASLEHYVWRWMSYTELRRYRQDYIMYVLLVQRCAVGWGTAANWKVTLTA